MFDKMFIRLSNLFKRDFINQTCKFCANQARGTTMAQESAVKVASRAAPKTYPASWGSTGIYQFTGKGGVKITVVDPAKSGSSAILSGSKKTK